MEKRVIGVLIFVLSIFLFSCSSQQTGVVVAEFGQEQITLNELKEAYKKNQSPDVTVDTDSIENLKEFTDLYVNYKMKLRDAYVRGYHNYPKLNEEISDYIETVGPSYVEEKFIMEPGVKDLYDRRKVEKRISHILFRKDTVDEATARKKAEGILDRIKNGESFEELAYKYTEDEFSKPDSGDIYWLTAGQIIPEFDEVIKNTGKGEVYPELVETKYGFHIMKITDEQPRKFEIRAQHILSSFNRGGRVDTAEAWETIQLVQKKLEEGEQFDVLAKKYSTDEGSAIKGGDLGFFQRRMMVKPFDEAVFNLDVDEVSDIIESRFGYHLIKLNEVKDYPPLEEQKSNLKSIYQKSNYLIDKDIFIDSLKERYSYKVNQAVWDSVAEGNNKLVIGDTYWGSELELAYGDSLLFQINGKDYSVNDIMTELSENENYKIGRMTKAVMYKAFTEKVEEKLFLEKAYELSKSDTELARLMDDYRNGLYIFELQEDEIWNKIDLDSTKLAAIYEENKSDYMWPERVTYKVIYRRSEAKAADDLEKVKSGTPFEKVVEENSKDVNLQKRSGLRELQIATSNQIAEQAYELEKPGNLSEVFEVGGGWYFVELVEKVPPQQKTFEEAKPELIGVYQEQQTKMLENAYLNRLKDIYEPEIYYDRLYQTDNN